MLNETLTTHVPPLETLQRFLFQLQISQCPEAASSDTAQASIREVASITDSLLSGRDEKSFALLAQNAYAEILKEDPGERIIAAKKYCRILNWTVPPQSDSAQPSRMAAMYNFSNLESLLPDDPKCAACGDPAAQRCSRCKSEWYCSRACQVHAWKLSHKKVCDLLKAGAAAEMQETKDPTAALGDTFARTDARIVEL